jgi:hypothetical protein
LPLSDREAAVRPRPASHRYRVDIAVERGERVFIVVDPAGARLYTYTDSRTAEAEADALNGTPVPPSARTGRPSAS